MAESMTNAAQIQLGIGQNQLSVFKQISDSARAVMDGAAQSVRDASNIWEGTVRSAQGYKQQQIDTFFKNEQLKLDDKRIQNEALYRDAMVSRQNAALGLQQQGLELDRAKFNAELQKIQEGDRHKLYTSGIIKQASTEEARLKEQINVIEANRKIAQTEYESLSPFQKNLGSGKELRAKISGYDLEATNLSKDFSRVRALYEEVNAVNAGMPPGTIIPLPQKERKDSGIPANQIDPFLPSGNGADPLNMFLPNATNGNFPAPATGEMEEAEQIRANLNISEETPGMLYGQMPNETFQSPLRLDNPEAVISSSTAPDVIEYPSRNDIIGGIMMVPFDKTKPEEFEAYISEYINAASPEDKAFITNDLRKGYENDFLMFIGTAKNYSPFEKTEDPNGFAESIIVDYKRTGGSERGLLALEVEAKRKLSEFRITLGREKNTDGSLKYLSQGGRNEALDNAVAGKYNEWIVNRGLEVQQSEDAKKQQDTKSGIVADGTINPEVVDTAFSESPLDVKDYSYKPNDNRMSAFLGTMERESKAMVDETNKFLDAYTFKDGENKGKIKRSFIKFVEQNIEAIEPGLLQIDISSEHNRRFYEQAKAEAVNKAVKSIGNNNKAVAFELWRKAGGLKK